MFKPAIILAWIFVSSSLGAGPTNLIQSLSPSFRTILVQRPSAMTALTNAFEGAFSNRTLRVAYYYSEEPDNPDQAHYYTGFTGQPMAVLLVRANDSDLDQLLGLICRALKDKGNERYQTIYRQAVSNSISRGEFVRQMARQYLNEFLAARKLINRVDLTAKEMAASNFWASIANCPEDLPAWFKNRGDVVEDLEKIYDELRQAGSQIPSSPP